jgi:hypothetical protein
MPLRADDFESSVYAIPPRWRTSTAYLNDFRTDESEKIFSVRGTVRNCSQPWRQTASFSRNGDLFVAVALWNVIALALVLLARGLPPRTFFVGDPGVKLIAARNAIEHPSRPLDIDLPRIGGQQVGLLDPFFRVHGDHAHATTSELFPLISAPLIAMFGIRGAFVLPAVGFLLALASIAYLGRVLDERRRWTLLLFVAVACTPLLFYALEFWEHTLAVGIAATGTILFVARRSSLSLLTSGLLLGLAALLRPEALCYCAALLVGARWLTPRPSIGDLTLVIVGVVIAYLSFATASAVHSGQLVGGHVTSNLSGIAQGWWANRVTILRVWFVPQNTAWFAGLAVLAMAALAAKDNPTGRKVVFTIGLAFVAVTTVAAASRVFQPASAWNAAPALLLAFMPFVRVRKGRTFLLVVALLSSSLVVLTAPNDGGGQWAPRYLLFASIPLAILSADAIERTRSVRFVGTATVAVLLLSCLFVQRNAYKELQSTKRTYERIVQLVERETPPGSYIVTDLWWLDQVTAALYPTRIVLFVDGAASAVRAFGLLATAPSIFVVRSDIESPPDAFDSWLDGTAFVIIRRTGIPERSLALSELVNRR